MLHNQIEILLHFKMDHLSAELDIMQVNLHLLEQSLVREVYHKLTQWKISGKLKLIICQPKIRMVDLQVWKLACQEVDLLIVVLTRLIKIIMEQNTVETSIINIWLASTQVNLQSQEVAM